MTQKNDLKTVVLYYYHVLHCIYTVIRQNLGYWGLGDEFQGRKSQSRPRRRSSPAKWWLSSAIMLLSIGCRYPTRCCRSVYSNRRFMQHDVLARVTLQDLRWDTVDVESGFKAAFEFSKKTPMYCHVRVWTTVLLLCYFRVLREDPYVSSRQSIGPQYFYHVTSVGP